MGLQGEKTASWFHRGRQVLVNGVSSGFRYWGDDDTMVIDHGEGAYIFDMDGKRYIDYHLGFGPVILGHGHPAVAKAVAEAAADGTTFAMTTRREIEAAERVKNAVGYIDAMRFTNTGTEATLHAIRLARAATGREVIVKFEGAYHGAHDYVLFSTASATVSQMGSRRSPLPLQASSGIPEAVRATVRTVPYNDLEAMENLLRTDGHHVAALLVEPMLGNFFGLLPIAGYLEGLRTLADQHGCLLIFDEVKTGFRIAFGGAQELFGVTPDLGTFAKAMGNGFPVAAVGGKQAVMDVWAAGGVTQAGTYSGNAVAAAAASATIDVLATGEPYARIEKTGGALADGLVRICADHGVPAHGVGHPSMVGLFLGEEPPRDFRDFVNHDADLYGRVAIGMIHRGAFPVDDAREPLFLSAAHSDEDIATTLTAFEDSLVEALG
ncbi:MAG: aspartate aminotransferase family protein [Acidimicrobiia bacterium]